MHHSAIAILAILALGVPPAYASAGPGVIGQWRFDEPGGQLALDDGPSGLHGELGSTVGPDPADPVRIPGLSGGALHFDGDTYVRLPIAAALAPPVLTIEAVVRAKASPGQYRYVVSRGSRGCFSGTYGLYTAQNGGLAFYIFDGERYLVSSSAGVADIWNGDWHSVAGVYDGAALRLFVDGRQIGKPMALPPDTAIGYDGPAEQTYIGTYIGTCVLPFVGDLDSVRILGAAQTPGEVVAAAVDAGVPVAADAGAEPLPAAAEPAIVTPAARPPSACTVTVSRKTIRVRRRSVIAVRAARNGRPLRRAHIAVRRAGQARILASTRTNATGRGQVALRISKIGRLRVSISGNASCSPAYIRVASSV
jgi:hypothetical protein